MAGALKARESPVGDSGKFLTRYLVNHLDYIGPLPGKTAGCESGPGVLHWSSLCDLE